MIDYLQLIVTALCSFYLPLLLFILKKIYYINHVVTRLEEDIKFILRELDYIKKVLYEKLNK